MASYNKFNVFTKDLVDGQHNFATHAFKVMLSNTAPVDTNAVFTDIVEITPGNGYSPGGVQMPMTVNSSGGVAQVNGGAVVFVGVGGTFGPFRYVVLYNATILTQPLVAWFDYGSSISVGDAETLSVVPDPANGLFTVT